MSDEDYKQGYRDGYLEGMNTMRNLYPNVIPKDQYPATKSIPPVACPVCGITYTDSLGRPIVMGYVCNHHRCPNKATC